MSACIPATIPLETPPGLTSSGKYVVVVDALGVTKILAVPEGVGFLHFDGEDIFWADGSNDRPINLSSLPEIATTQGSILTLDSDGRLRGFVNATGTPMVLKSINGTIVWEAVEDDVLPAGAGIFVRQVDGSDVALLSAEGTPHIKDDDSVESIPDGNVGTVYKMTGTGPKWEEMSNGSIASGTAGIDISGVIGSSVGTSQVNIKAPVFGLTDGTDSETVINVDVTVDLTDPNGLLGLDVGGEASNTWYYVYVTSDGTDVSAIISLSPTAPDLSGTTHTFYGLASVFRNDGSGNIRAFLQRGRAFSHAHQVVTNTGTTTTSLNTLAIPSGTLPPNVKSCSGVVGGSSTAGTERRMVLASTTGGIGAQHVGAANTGTVTVNGFRYDQGCFYDLAISDASSPEIAWSSSASDTHRRLVVFGFKV